MAITEAYELDGVTVGVAELSIVSGTTSLQTITTAGVYQLWVDCAAMAKADEFIIRVYEKVEATGGTKRVAMSWSLLGVQASLFVTPSLVLMNGWDFTIQRLAGADRAFDASIRRVA